MGRLPLMLALLGALAQAKPWNGIEPGVSKSDEVVKKFGEPSKRVTTDGKEVLAYFQKQAIKGTTQVQFRIDTNQIVERMDVFPAPVIDKDAIEGSYGPSCSQASSPVLACYQKKVTDDFRTYFDYPKLGVAVFFNEDGKTVQSFIFQPAKK